MEKAFGRRKKQCLDRLDASKKGSVDAGAVRVVSLLNGFENYCTTSSCSGRIVLVDGVPESRGVQKQNCVWLFVSHQKCQAQDLVSALAGSTGDAALKFEPFVLHVQCRRLQDAQLVHSVAVNSGFRNSGLTVSKAGKIVAAVRSTHGLEVPLSQRGKLLVGQDYIHVLVRVANQKMEENLKRIHRFYTNLQSALTAGQLQELQIRESSPTPEAETDEDAAKDGDGRKVYRRRRKRERRQTDCRHGNTDSSQPELEDCLDLFAGGAVGVEPAN